MAASNRRQAFVLFALGEFDDQDGVLARQADQHDESDLREDVVVAALEPHARDGEQQAHRHDENDGQRQAETFV